MTLLDKWKFDRDAHFLLFQCLTDFTCGFIKWIGGFEISTRVLCKNIANSHIKNMFSRKIFQIEE